MKVMHDWLIEYWGTIVDIFVWGITIIMFFILAYLLYKIFKLRFKSIDVIGLVVSVGWILFILFFGFDHVRLLLQGILYSEAVPL